MASVGYHLKNNEKLLSLNNCETQKRSKTGRNLLLGTWSNSMMRISVTSKISIFRLGFALRCIPSCHRYIQPCSPTKTCSRDAPNITHFPAGFRSFTGRSPLFGHFSTTLLGLDTIRAFGVQEVFTDQMNSYQDAHTRAWFTFISCSAWISYRLDVLCVIFIAFVALVSPALKSCKLYLRCLLKRMSNVSLYFFCIYINQSSR